MIGSGIKIAATLPSGGGNWWEVDGATLFCAYDFTGVASLAAGMLDLSGNTNDAYTVSADPTWDATNGAKFDGTQYLGVPYTPTGGTTTYEVVTMWVQFTNVTSVGTNAALCGMRTSTTSGLYIAPVYSGTCRLLNYGLNNSGADITDGTLAIAGQTGYRNAVSVGSIPTDSLSTSAEITLGGARRNSGLLNYPITGYIQRFALWTTVLSGTDISTVEAAVT